MKFALFVVILALDGLTPPAGLLVGDYSSLAVCETAKTAFLTQLAAPAPIPAGPQFARHVSCVLISDGAAPAPVPAPVPTPVPAPVPAPVPTAAPPVVTPLQGSITTAQGTWTLGAKNTTTGGGAVLLNGAHFAGSYSIAITQVGGVLYHFVPGNQWRIWNGMTWTFVPPPIAAGWRWAGTTWVK